ncbi:MAG: hypothetical protein QGF59_07815, partial [Pirellulaceae bacterium]|nr:hypothetical protein [Pirellulaceae bacterium]
ELHVKHIPALTQSKSLPLGGGLPSPTIEKALDRLTSITQLLNERISRAMLFTETSANADVAMPDLVASKLFQINSSADGLDLIDVADISTSIDTVLTSLASGDFLKYDGTNWINRTGAQVRTDIGIDGSSGNIASGDLAASAVATAKIAASAVTTAKIAANAIDETLMKDAFIGDFTDATITAADTILFGDDDDSGDTKRDTVQGILDLVSAGGLVPLSQTTISNDATVDVETTAAFDGTYELVLFTISELITATNGVDLEMKLSDDGGATYASSNYNWVVDGNGVGGVLDSNSTGSGAFKLNGTVAAGNIGNAAGETAELKLWMHSPNGATNFKLFQWELVHIDPTSPRINCIHGAGSWDNTVASIEGLRFRSNSGNLTSGVIRAYGVVNS